MGWLTEYSVPKWAVLASSVHFSVQTSVSQYMHYAQKGFLSYPNIPTRSLSQILATLQNAKSVFALRDSSTSAVLPECMVMIGYLAQLFQMWFLGRLSYISFPLSEDHPSLGLFWSFTGQKVFQTKPLLLSIVNVTFSSPALSPASLLSCP